MRDPKIKRLLISLALANFFLYFGFNVWRAIFNNFAVDVIGVSATQIGVIQSLRELPGLMGFVLGFLVLWLSEMRVMGISVLLVGLGIVLTGWADGLVLFIAGTLTVSMGFHFFYPSNASVVLMGVDKGLAPRVLGILNGMAAIAAVVGTGVVAIFVSGVQWGPVNIPAWGYRTTLYVTGAVVIAGSVLALRNGFGKDKGRQQEKRKVIFRREYGLYYSLTFFMGVRRHIFTTFAIFMLVQVYHTPVQQTALLLMLNNVINTFTAPLLGYLVAWLGERLVLTINFLGLVGVFLGYAFVPIVPVLFALFVLDHVFFGFNLALESYFQKIARSPQEITSNVSMAQTINHVSALVVPVLGGLLWEYVSPSAPFLVGVGVAVISLVLVQFIRTPALPTPAPLPAK
jgi:MFS family permease